MGRARRRLVWKKTTGTFRNTQRLVFMHLRQWPPLFIPLVSFISTPALTYKSPAFSLPHNKLMPHTHTHGYKRHESLLQCFTANRQPFLWHISLGRSHLRWAAASNWIIAREDEGSLTDDREAGQRAALTDNLSLPPLSFISHHFFGLRTLEGHLVITSFFGIEALSPKTYVAHFAVRLFEPSRTH